MPGYRFVLVFVLGLAGGIGLTAVATALRPDGEIGPRTVTPRVELTAEERSVTSLFEEASPSVVYITSIALRRDFFRLNVMEIPRGTGSGFIWDDEGHVVTNYHVIRDGNRATMRRHQQAACL